LVVTFCAELVATKENQTVLENGDDQQGGELEGAPMVDAPVVE